MSIAGNLPELSPLSKGIEAVFVCLEPKGKKDPECLIKVMRADQITGGLPTYIDPNKSMTRLERCRSVVLRKPDMCGRIFARIEGSKLPVIWS